MSAPRDALLSADANRRMFDSIAGRYDLLNRVMSLGLDRRWRRRAVAALAPQGGERYLDVGCGTGDVMLEVLRAAPASTVVGVDPARAMMAVAASKAARAGVAERAAFVAGDALRLPFADAAVHGVISAFTLRNLTDRRQACRELRRVLVPGGRLVLLETSVPANRLLRLGHRLYVGRLVPFLGMLLACSRSAYRYLAASIGHFPAPAEIVASMTAAGLRDPAAQPLAGGIVTLYTARVG